MIQNTNTTTAKRIGVIIEEKRKLRKLTQEELAVLAFDNIQNRGLVSRIENGKHTNVRFDSIYLILAALGIDLFDILPKLKTK